MKKILLALLAYLMIAFLICMGISGFAMEMPVVLDSQHGSFIFFRGMLYFLRALPALFGSAFLMLLSIYFGSNTGSARDRFSPAIFRHFKMVMLTSLGMVFILALSTEIFVPAINARQRLAEAAPRLLNEYLISGRYCYVIKNYYLAHEYGRQALRLSPGNQDAQRLIDDSERSLHSMRARPQSRAQKVDNSARWRELQNETVTSLLKKSQKAYEEERWFDAHYYAQLAVSSGNESDVNLLDARRMAAEAWNRLNDSAPIADQAAKKLFEQKKRAYFYLMNDDNLEAYYEFQEMYNTAGVFVDPDIKNYYEIAKERLAREAFFIDETLHLQLFESSQNVYFTIAHPDGARDVVYIKGITMVSNSGRMIQYLRDFSMYSYGRDGRFIRSVTTPYAKMVAESVSIFDSQTASLYDIQESYKSVPYVILQSVARESTRLKNEPTFQYNPDIPLDERQEDSVLILAMPFADFNLACDATIGPKNMNLLSLLKIVDKAANFGYSEEVFQATLIQRLMYPLLLLILMIVCASFAWNYRLKNNQVFKFIWILSFPVCTLVLYLIMEICMYVSEVLCYALVGFSGQFSVISAVVIYTVLLIVSSVFFLARRSRT
ncbi:MAG: hypothetical protein IJS09_01965 [Treponema sp.]|nr:hypothetical protein [Treponema sp.]